jgi:hypothetical protein
LIRRAFGEIFANSLELQILLGKSTKFVPEFCGLDPLGILALVDTATLTSRLPFCQNDFSVKFFLVVFIKEKVFWNNATHIHLTAIIIAYHDGN